MSSLSFVKVASKSELAAGSMKGVKAGLTQILLVNLAGNYYAIGDICKHRGCKLSTGTLTDEVVQCPCHGSRFNVKTGKVVRGPAAEPEPTYEIKVENDQVLVKA